MNTWEKVVTRLILAMSVYLYTMKLYIIRGVSKSALRYNMSWEWPLMINDKLSTSVYETIIVLATRILNF